MTRISGEGTLKVHKTSFKKKQNPNYNSEW